MLRQVAMRLDAWVTARNLEARAEGLLPFRACRIRVVGQQALLEARCGLELNLTNDLDVHADYEHAVEVEFRRLLREVGLELDPVGHAAWMPRETRYSTLLEGEWVTMQLADADAVLLSKARKAPEKNRALIVEFLAKGASERFLALAKRYDLDLERFL